VLPDSACVFTSRVKLEPESTQHKQTGQTPDKEVKNQPLYCWLQRLQ